jgi:hypothetical protein
VKSPEINREDEIKSAQPQYKSNRRTASAINRPDRARWCLRKGAEEEEEEEEMVRLGLLFEKLVGLNR